MTATAARPSVLPEGRHEVLPASTASFTVAHFRVQKVRGTLGDVRGTIEVADGRIVADGSVDAASVRTGTPPRDAHLRSYLFAVGEHPRMRLQVDATAARDVPATVWIRGRPVTVLARIEVRDDGLRVRFDLDRRAAGLTWPAPVEAGGVAVGRRVAVELLLVLRPAAV
jgi:polyisoprenoid-binding protein YceI